MWSEVLKRAQNVLKKIILKQIEQTRKQPVRTDMRRTNPEQTLMHPPSFRPTVSGSSQVQHQQQIERLKHTRFPLLVFYCGPFFSLQCHHSLLSVCLGESWDFLRLSNLVQTKRALILIAWMRSDPAYYTALWKESRQRGMYSEEKAAVDRLAKHSN